MKRDAVFFISLFFLSAALSAGEKSFVPLESAEVKTFYSSSRSFIPLTEGTGLKEGMNFYLYENGYYKPADNFSVDYTLRQELNADFSRAGIYKAYADYRPGIFGFTFGKTSKAIGPSENSLILSKNAPPFLMLDMETAKPVHFLGDWKFNILNGRLDEKRKDRSNTRIIILRADYAPSKVINLGLNRFEQYGGSGRPDYKLWEFPKLLLGADDNISYSKYDADGYLGYDLSLDLSRYFRKAEAVKVYFQQIATDISAPWQKEDKDKYSFPFIIKLRLCSYQAGIEIKKEKDIFNLEFTAINPLFYTHHFYNVEGYSYDGFALGNSYGNNLWEIYFTQKHSLKGEDCFKYKTGFVKQPAFSSHNTGYLKKAEKYYLETEYSRTSGNKTFAPYIRLEYSRNYDAAPRPMLYDIRTADKFYLITGLSTKIKF